MSAHAHSDKTHKQDASPRNCSTKYRLLRLCVMEGDPDDKSKEQVLDRVPKRIRELEFGIL